MWRQAFKFHTRTRTVFGTSKRLKIEYNYCTYEVKCLDRRIYTGKELSIDKAKEIMSKYVSDDGSVDLNESENDIAKVCISNPMSRNALNVKMMFDLEKIVDKLDQQVKYKGVIMHGSDGHFCSGGDKNVAKQMMKPETGYAMAIYMNYILKKFKNLPMITVAFIEGSGAIGGGAELTTACDYRMMSNKVETTVIGFPHAKMGIVPAWGSTGRLISITGYQNAMDLLLDCRLLKAAEAMDIGLVDGTMATLQDVTDWLSLKTRHPVNVIRAIKGSLSCYGDGVDQRASELMESKIFAPLWGGSADQHHDTADKSD